MHKITLLGTGLIGQFYAASLIGMRNRDEIKVVYSRSPENARKFAEKWHIQRWTTDLAEAIRDPETDVVVIGLPNHLHKEATLLAAEAQKAVLCTKPLARTAEEAWEMLEAVEKAGVFHGYLEDLVYTPKTLKALEAVRQGALGKVLWARSRETHGGPHSDWFWKKEFSGGGALIDMGCHCIEIGRNFIGKEVRPVEAMCWADTQVHPIEAEDHAIGLIRYENGAIGQFEVAWNFRGGMDLRDEVAGTQGTIWLNHWLRTGFELFTAVGPQGYVAEKAEGTTGWLFPVGDEIGALGYVHMFLDQLNALDQNRAPMETFYDGYVVNAIMDACYRSVQSKQWEPILLKEWRGGGQGEAQQVLAEYDPEHWIIKTEKMPDGSLKYILRHKQSGEITQKIVPPAN
ncbi:Gfo/Idh/MocA family oxidoreductase [Thermanaerothrix sp. 4228-RoL]|uniref:Gfo/Idh/MocA family oxidoreductase n=1 Tax=Thermanaerothrix solaris TaxID=3058434 RepID=A0ABU3NK60_9CHLR|nr:Gfo/Idh/MocA family oxidoreductase [Thermanaerothrix sp. 4228-RoL]MDT8897177.1 Gfo/Idh/MocA family oxidoreductase [Thermanaerothrix sp. 4228-RoL]